MAMWRCNNCKYMHQGEMAPDFCPRCGAEKAEFDLLPVEPSDERAKKLQLADFLLINGSVHRHHNTRLFLETAAEVFEKAQQSYQIINLTEFRIDPCWHCYSMREKLVDLEKFAKLTIGRELKMVELKHRVSELEKMDQPPEPPSP